MQKLVAGNFSGPGSEAQKARHQQLLDLMVPGTTLEPIVYSEIGSVTDLDRGASAGAG